MPMPTPEGSSPASSLGPATKPKRVLACQQCQSRKLGCDRTFPCGNCTKARLSCVPNTNPRPRRRRFAERVLLDCLRYYEGLLDRNGIPYKPLYNDTAMEQSHIETIKPSKQEPWSALAADAQATTGSRNVSVCGPVDQVSHRCIDATDSDGSDEDVALKDGLGMTRKHDTVVKEAWDKLFASNESHLFGYHKSNIDLRSLHPKETHILKLWQIYLDNVNPLLKVTHTSLQARIIDSTSDLTNVKPALEALMFSIYCVAVLSLDDKDCVSFFGSSKEVLMHIYRSGCQQALLNAGVYRTSDRECLTAFYLYLISIRRDTDPRSLSAILGVAVRIAQRMGIHSESANAKFSIFEAEMRRRLWWSLIAFDNRICEMADCKTAMLTPTWDCHTPLNVSDYELRPDVSTPPPVRNEPSEAIFTAVRSEIADHVRHSIAHLDYSNPALRPLAKYSQNAVSTESSQLTVLEKTIEEKWLKHCNSEDPLHYMTIWASRGSIGKCYLLEHYLKQSRVRISHHTEEPESSVTVAHMLTMLRSDTMLMTSPLTRGFRWFIHLNYPLPAVVCLSHTLRRWPTAAFAKEAWRVMNENYEARIPIMQRINVGIHKLFFDVIVQAWKARQEKLQQQSIATEPEPVIVLDILRKQKILEQRGAPYDAANTNQELRDMEGSGETETSPFMPLAFDAFSLPFESLPAMQPECQLLNTWDPSDIDAFGASNSDWAMIDWDGSKGFI